MRLQSDKIRAEAMIRCIGIEDLRARIQTAEEDKKIIAEKQEQLQGKIKERSAVRGETEQELIQSVQILSPVIWVETAAV